MMNGMVYLLFLLGYPAIHAAMEGHSDDTSWAFQWYIGEPFKFKCDVSQLNITSGTPLQVMWDTPTSKLLSGEYDDERFKTMDADGVEDVELLVKNVQTPVHGVYVCHVFDKNTVTKEGKVVYGLNIREPKYHDMMDKYRSNIIVAFVATAVFIVPVATIAFVWKFQYRSPEEKEKLAARKLNQKYMYNGNEMDAKDPEGIAATVQSPEGRGAYDNPSDTRL